MSPPQLPLALRFPPDQRLETFVGSLAGRDLVAAIARGERHDWLMVAGPAGCGKSHLLLGACAEAAGSDRQAVYLSVKDPTPALAARLEGQERADLVCLDDLDAVAGDRDAELDLFDFHNRARAAGAVVIYSAVEAPPALPLVLPDLRSRLSQCVQLVLAALDDAGRREVLRGRAAGRGLELDAPVLDYLFARVGRDLGTLTALLDRLDRDSLAAQRRITVPFLRQVLAERE